MKEQYISVVGIRHYYGAAPFRIGKKVKCVKEPENPFDSEAIRVQLKHIGKIGYVANSPYTVAAGTKSAGAIAHKVKKKFTAEVMFITRSQVICRVTDGFKTKKTNCAESNPAEDGTPVKQLCEETSHNV